ncbi:ubiquitin carboxyl-terminal hydrolase CYLD-like [Mya arenaria]|uniref:ubiquitin carboxyl-terminal hydrolase CYLD-like n=1 Tax=Mya arenaria TaxID=6604 RepID=UPI0022E20E46|nr:ubiquitin carboxyl-terminal hydrolase CYLD-like [Mya arenaria]
MERFCILLRNSLGKKKEKGLIKSTTSKVDVLPGTLLILMYVDNSHHSQHSYNQYVLETIDQDNVEVRCSVDDFKEISRDAYDLLITIPTCNERITIYLHESWLKDGLELNVGDYVEVYDKASAKDLIGVLRFKGNVEGIKGIHFGVELIYDRGRGTSDGVFRKQRFFQCRPESAIFVGLHRIRKHMGTPPKPPPSPTPGGAQFSSNVLGLQIGDRIVWMSDLGPEYGSVKWIGLLPDSRSDDDITVGVEFDNPVGSGTGKYRDQRLFTSKQNHASLVPILGLLKEKDFLSMQQEGAEADFNMADYADDRGKSKSEILEEQERLLLANKKSQSRKVAGSCELSERTAQIEPPPPPHQPAGSSKGVNPLYEYTRPEKEYIPELGNMLITDDDLLPHGSQGPVLSSSSRAKNLPEMQPDPDLTVGSLVEVMSQKPLYGLIKWIGNLPDQKEPKKLIAGLEMEEEINAGTDGTFGLHRLFTCPPRKGFFVPLYKCRKDKRFTDDKLMHIHSDRSINFGSTETPDLEGTVSPPDSLWDVSIICGKGKGIQGHHNSCYMDATLLAMFYFTTVFDSILYRPKNAQDILEYSEVQQVLKEGIVNPLRKHHYVRADKMMKLRKLLDKVGKIPGMMSEEKDPEEFLNLLLNEITKADPFLKICTETNNQDVQHTFFYQLIMEKDERLVLPTTQQLFELSFLQMGIKLQEVPSCLIIQMPRFGKEYKMYKRILPSLELDITDVLENVPRECIICGDLAMFECKECYHVHGDSLSTIAFCEGCKRTSHQHKLRVNHKCRQIHVPQWYLEKYHAKQAQGQAMAIPREKMELFCVICIQTSHYVSFVKTGKGKDAKWIFFDSMADRMGEQSGYNIPEVKECSEIPRWLSDEYYKDIMKSPDDKNLPEHMRRLICDAYICMYQSLDVMKFN